jgi:hypothetical protein
LWKMENRCINGWSKRMNIVYCNIFHGLEWFSGFEFLVIELDFWQLQSCKSLVSVLHCIWVGSIYVPTGKCWRLTFQN